MASERVPELLRFIVVDSIKRGARRVLVQIPDTANDWKVSAADWRSIAGAFANLHGAKAFRMALLAPNDELYVAVKEVAKAADESAITIVAFRLHHEAVRWLS